MRLDLPRWAVLLISAVLWIAHYGIFASYFPTRADLVGNDYSWFLPSMLDSHYWFKANDLLSVQWFTPSFCGGLPKLANPQDVTYSLPQLFFSLAGPISGLRLTLLACGALGLSGAYFLLRGPFATSRAAALLGGAIFLFNGFFAERMIVGHLSFHAFMLVPWATYFLLRASRSAARLLDLDWALYSALCGLCVAYMFFSGMVHLILPAGSWLLGSGALLALIHGRAISLRRFALGLAAAGVWAFALTAAHLSLWLAYLRQAPRDFYQIPTVAHLTDLLGIVVRVLFFATPDPERLNALLVSPRWFLGPHEWAFNVSYVPLMAGVILLTMAVQRWRATGRPLVQALAQASRPGRRTLLLLGSLLAVFLLPILLNLHLPLFQALLKQLPLFRNSSNLLRWLCLYIPLLSVLSALALDRSALSGRVHVSCGVLLTGLVMTFNMGISHGAAPHIRFHPGRVTWGYERAQHHGFTPEVKSIVISADRRGRPMQTLGRNDVLAEGESQMVCYEPMFGYGLETFPFKTLRPGPALRERGGVLNVKNPACYLFPEENGCQPGDHFRVEQRPAAEAFLRYRPFPFVMSTRQVWANRLVLLALASLLSLFGVAAARALRARRAT